MDKGVRRLRAARQALEGQEEALRQVFCLMGFDAFVDEISHMVDERQDLEHYRRMETIGDLGQRIQEAAGLSVSLERVVLRTTSGGSAVNTGMALMAFGCPLVYIGAIGKPDIHPAFADLVAAAERAYAIANPGHTLALEFRDGKILICNTEPLQDITWSAIEAAVGVEQLAQDLGRAQVVGSINWTMTPYMNHIWQVLQEEVLPQVTFAGPRPIFFVDPIDPAKRSATDIVAGMECLARFGSHYRVVLSLNRKEATEVGRACGLDVGVPLPEAELARITTALAQRLGLYGLMVHPVDRAAAVIDGHYYEVEGPYTPTPRVTTAAGDKFNAGAIVALALDMDPELALVAGVAASGFFVREARNPSVAQWRAFLDTWAEHYPHTF